jgi:hypothetical protein
MQFLIQALKALPAVAASPLALAGYVSVLASWTIVALRVKRNRNLLSRIEKFPPRDRLAALKAEMGVVDVPAGLSAEQYLRSRLHTNLLFAYILTAILLAALIALSMLHRGTLDVDIQPAVGRLRLELISSAFAEEPPGPDPDFVFRATSFSEGGVTYVGYTFPYLEKVKKGLPIVGKSADLHNGMLPYEFPELTCRVLNNTGRTILFTRAIVTDEWEMPPQGLRHKRRKIAQRQWLAANQRGCTVYGSKNETASAQPNSS